MTLDEKRDMLEAAIYAECTTMEERAAIIEVCDFAFNSYGVSEDTLDHLSYYYFGSDFDVETFEQNGWL